MSKGSPSDACIIVCCSAFCEDPHYVEVPVVDLGDENCVALMKIPMLDVHTVLAYVHDEAKLRTPTSHINMYWSWHNRFGAPWAKLGGPTVIPCGLYADETRYGGAFSHEKVLGVFVNLVLHRPRSIRYSRFCICAIRSHLVLGNRTLYPIFRRIVFGFHLAYRGIRQNGEQLCSDGSTFLCTELRGDLLWHKMIWRFKDVGWQAKDVCWFCKARNTGEPLYSETGPEASWVETTYEDTWQWAAETLPENDMCPLLALPGFCIEVIRLCEMHTMNLGILQVCNGSALSLDKKKQSVFHAYFQN